MINKEGLKNFLDEFGLYIFIFFSSFVISLFESIVPNRIYFEQTKSQILALHNIIEEKMSLFINQDVTGFQNVLGLDIIYFLGTVVLISSILFFIQIFRFFKFKFFIKRSDFSLCPLWDLKDFFKILIWVIFWMQVFSVSDDIFGWITGTTNERLFILLSFISSFALDIAVAVLIIYWLKKKYKQTLPALGIKIRQILHDFKLGFLSYMSFLPVIFIVFMFSAAYFQKYDSGGSGQLVFYFLIFEKNPYILAAVSLFVAVIGPFVEELFFRGLLYGSLKKSIGIFQAALVSSLVFSMLHMNLIGLLPILSLAMLLVYLYEKTGSFWVPFFVHVLHNSFILAVVLLWRRQIGI